MDIEGKTIKEIIRNNYRMAAVLEKYEPEVYKKGNFSFNDFCHDTGVEKEKLLRELDEKVQDALTDHAGLEADELADYITVSYHNFIIQALDILEIKLEVITSVHVRNHPELAEVQELFGSLKEELLKHLGKEKRVLFSHIKEMAAAKRSGTEKPQASCFTTVNKPLAVLNRGHEDVFSLIDEIRELTSDYEIPENACRTYKSTYRALQEFEEDLKQSMFLENEVLFPKARELEKLFAK